MSHVRPQSCGFLYLAAKNKELRCRGDELMSRPYIGKIGGIFLFVLMMVKPGSAQDSVADFYRGKSFSIVIGATPGGGYDTYARVIARFLGKHIPGNPAITPQNMPGASSNVAAAWIYNVAQKDGLAMAAVTPGALMEPLLSDKVQVKIDATKFNHIGSATRDVFICAVRRDAPVQKFEDVFNRELIIGAVAEGGSARDFPLLLNNVLATKFKIISGYPGNRELTFAMETGEVQGVCGNSYAGLLVIRADWFKPGGIARVLVQEDLNGHPNLNKAGVPLAIQFARTDEAKQIISLLYEELLFSRPYVMAPDVAPERVAAIRNAFSAVMRDPELLAEAQRMNLEVVDPLDGPELQKIILRQYSVPKEIIEKARRALKD